ncbi:MAG: ParB/RepB/Spo0J family partition protein [Planctomycetota bacterium]|jgi:ParB family chromosome partitioning protein|nr:MAG: ParB/RepB/Spo0J family partition protein [Planctomycetota bacterium]
MERTDNKNSQRMGRGLESLFGAGAEASHQSEPTKGDIPVGVIETNPNQPRKHFDPDELAKLRQSIQEHGLLQPVLVRPKGERFQLIAGERRLRAAIDAGLENIPVHIVNFDDQKTMEAALVENIQRSDLNPIEKAQGFKDYLGRFQMTHDELAKRLGMGRPTITNLVALLELPAEVQDAVRSGQITTGHAKAIKGLPSGDKQATVCKQVIAMGLSVHATEQMVRQQASTPSNSSSTNPADPAAKGSPAPSASGSDFKTDHVRGIEEELAGKLAMKVAIKLKGPEKGTVTIAFETGDDFERLVERLRL